MDTPATRVVRDTGPLGGTDAFGMRQASQRGGIRKRLISINHYARVPERILQQEATDDETI
jgi:hypothetical protein